MVYDPIPWQVMAEAPADFHTANDAAAADLDDYCDDYLDDCYDYGGDILLCDEV